MSISELGIKVEDLETLITSVKETSFHNTSLIMTVLAFVVAVLSLLGNSVIKNLIKERFTNFYDKNIESLQAEIRIETKKELSNSDFRNDIGDNVKDLIYSEMNERIEPTLTNGANAVDGYSRVSYSRLNEAYILINGSIVVTAPSLSMFTLAAGYRPMKKKKIITFAKRESDGYLYPVEIEVNPQGAFIIVSNMYGPSEVHLNMEMISIN